MTDQQIKEMSLKSQISRQVRLKEHKEATLAQMTDLFVQSLGAMTHLSMAEEVVSKLVWDYVDLNHLWWKGDSAKMNEFSIIKDYTNKAGKTFKAHYTVNDYYLCKAKEDDKPISYQGNFPITRLCFDYSLTKNKKWEIKFEPKAIQPVLDPNDGLVNIGI